MHKTNSSGSKVLVQTKSNHVRAFEPASTCILDHRLIFAESLGGGSDKTNDILCTFVFVCVCVVYGVLL